MLHSGEEWLIRKPGAYLTGVHEVECGIEDGFVLTYVDALHMRAKDALVDALGKKRYIYAHKSDFFFLFFWRERKQTHVLQTQCLTL